MRAVTVSVQTSAGGTTTVFYYAGSQVVLEKPSGPYGQGDTFTAVHTYGNARRRRNSEYPLYDGHGSERTVTSGFETVTVVAGDESPACDNETRLRGFMCIPRGRDLCLQTDDSSSGAGAWGYRTDGDAGLMHVGAHYHDAQVGSFITRDTVLSEHPYLYCEHEPVNWVDAGGNAPVRILGIEITRGEIGATIGGIAGSFLGPIGAGVGAGMGSYIGRRLDGEKPDVALAYACRDGVIGLVAGGGAKKVVGKAIRLIKGRPPVIDPVTRSSVWRMINNGIIRR